MGHFNGAATQAAALVLTSSLLVAGCSSSSESPALSEDDNVVSDINSDATTAQPEADSISSGASDEVIVSANEPIEEANELLAPSSDNIPAETIDNEQNSEPTTDAIPDPLVLNSTQVDFGITVPAYQSDALQVRLIWGDTDVTAGWVGDELWSTSLELPTNIENTLSVTFSDSNGDIVLASFEQAYRTSSNAAEMFNITADQFNSEQWDDDADGISNLDESIMGTDPLIDENNLLEMRDSVSFFYNEFEVYENRISAERPYSFNSEVVRPVQESGPPRGTSQTIAISIDGDGNGTLSDFEQSGTAPNWDEITIAANRIKTSESISWDVTENETNYGSFRRSSTTATNTVSIIDDITRTYEGVENFRTSNWESLEEWSRTASYELRGVKLENSNLCEMIAGTITEVETRNWEPDETGLSVDGMTVISKTITKESGEIHWRVTELTETTNSTAEVVFLARQLGTVQKATFPCEFVDP